MLQLIQKIRNKFYRSLGVTKKPENIEEYTIAVKKLISPKRFDEAKTKLQAGLDIHPNQFDLLNTASDLYRSLGDIEKSLEYAKLLITHHPENCYGYARAVEDLISLKRFDEAKTNLQAGLDLHPNQFDLLNSASELYRSLGDIEKSLEYAELLITNHPENCFGYARAVEDLKTINRSMKNPNLEAKNSEPIKDYFNNSLPNDENSYTIFDHYCNVPGVETSFEMNFFFNQKENVHGDGRCDLIPFSLDQKKVLDLGCFEGGHTYQLEKKGADVIGVEANPKLFLK